MIETSRRGLLLGLGALVAAPAIVRVTSLMPVKVMPAWGGAQLVDVDGLIHEVALYLPDDHPWVAAYYARAAEILDAMPAPPPNWDVIPIGDLKLGRESL